VFQLDHQCRKNDIIPQAIKLNIFLIFSTETRGKIISFFFSFKRRKTRGIFLHTEKEPGQGPTYGDREREKRKISLRRSESLSNLKYQIPSKKKREKEERPPVIILPNSTTSTPGFREETT
jgi:hypothetical protein